MVKMPIDVGTNPEENIIHEHQPDTAVNDNGAYEEEGDDGDDDEEEDLASLDDLEYNPMIHLSQIFVSESGVPIADILANIQKTLETQTKILHTLLNVFKAKNDAK